MSNQESSPVYNISNTRQPKSKIKRATRLVQPNYYDLFDWIIQTREVIRYHFTSRVPFSVYSRICHTDIHTKYVINDHYYCMTCS